MSQRLKAGYGGLIFLRWRNLNIRHAVDGWLFQWGHKCVLQRQSF